MISALTISNCSLPDIRRPLESPGDRALQALPGLLCWDSRGSRETQARGHQALHVGSLHNLFYILVIH